MKTYSAIPESDRSYAKYVAELENIITSDAEYLMGTSIRHSSSNVRAVKRAIELAEHRAQIIALHPAITRDVLTDVHSVLDTYPKPNW